MIRRVFLAFLVFGLVACGDDGTGPEDIAGTYTLQTVDGKPSPFFVHINEDADGVREFFDFNSGHMVLGPESSCELSETITHTVLVFHQVRERSSRTFTTGCTFVFSNGALTLTYTTDERTTSDTGSIAGSTLTITRNMVLWVFRK